MERVTMSELVYAGICYLVCTTSVQTCILVSAWLRIQGLIAKCIVTMRVLPPSCLVPPCTYVACCCQWVLHMENRPEEDRAVLERYVQ